MQAINFRFIPWLIAAALAVLLFFQRACTKKCEDSIVTKTVIIPGDTKLVKVQDTIIKIKRVQLPAKPGSRDTIIRYAYSTIHDTIRTKDVEVAIEDSLRPDSTIHRKVSIQNKRPIAMTEVSQPKFKVFLGFNIGVNLNMNGATATPSIIFVTKKDDMFSLSYDLLNNTPQIGMAWKIHLGK